MLKDGAYVGAVDGLRNWDEYLDEVAALLDAEPTRPPSVGVAVQGTRRRTRGDCAQLRTRSDAMKDFPLPVRMIGPGSQPADDDGELQYLAMPRDMNTFSMPRVPEAADAHRAADGARPAGGLPRATRGAGIRKAAARVRAPT